MRRVLLPGERLFEVELAEQLGVSRNPVREALTMLAREGWVDFRPRSGTYVHESSPKEIDDFFEMRALLEGYAAELAAIRIRAEDVVALRDHWRDGVDAVERQDLDATVAANSAFHARIHEVADNGVLQESLTRMKKRVHWYFATVATQRGMASWDEHLRIIDALERHDRTAAATLMRAHTNATADLYRLQRASRAEAGSD